MNGRFVGGFIVIAALIVGGLVYYTQVYAYYREVAAESPEAVIRLVPLGGGVPEPLLVEGFQGIDADSSPLRFRACFTTGQSLAMLTETYVIAEAAEPRVAPGWFSCFDAQAIGTALERGEAVAFLSERGIHPGFDRVVAVYPDGRGYAWHQPDGSAE